MGDITFLSAALVDIIVVWALTFESKWCIRPKMYPILAVIFFSTIAFAAFAFLGFLFKFRRHNQIAKLFAAWAALYALFITFGTGPVGERSNVPSISSPYKLPWEEGVSRFVSQGNRSFTSHRDNSLFAWDFWMPVGTAVLAARAGEVIAIEQSFDGIGFYSNYVTIRHDDGTKALYAHIKKDGAIVKIGVHVDQGQIIAHSGMVGQTINPHLHFVVFNRDETTSLPITFSDVPDGVPLSGRFYISGNSIR